MCAFSTVLLFPIINPVLHYLQKPSCLTQRRRFVGVLLHKLDQLCMVLPPEICQRKLLTQKRPQQAVNRAIGKAPIAVVGQAQMPYQLRELFH